MKGTSMANKNNISMPRCGAPGKAKITIEPLDGFSGEAKVVLKNMRPWNGKTIATRTINVFSQPEGR